MQYKKIIALGLIIALALAFSLPSYAYFMPKSTLNIYIDNVYQETVQLNLSGDRQWYLAINYSGGYRENNTDYGYLRGFGLTGSSNSPNLNLSIDSTKYPLINCTMSFVRNTTTQISNLSYGTYYSVGTNISDFDIMLYTKDYCDNNQLITIKTCVNEVKRNFMNVPVNMTYMEYHEYLDIFNISYEYFYNYYNISDLRFSTDTYTFNNNLSAGLTYCAENNVPLYLEYKYSGAYSYPRLPVHPYTDTITEPVPPDNHEYLDVQYISDLFTDTLYALPKDILASVDLYVYFISGLLILGILFKFIGGRKDV